MSSEPVLPIETEFSNSTIGIIGTYTIHRYDNPSLIEKEWIELDQSMNGNIYQSYEWASVTCKTFERDNTPCIIAGWENGTVQFVLPMVIEGGFFKTLRWIGGSHANICGGVFSTKFLKYSDPYFMKKLFELIGKSIGGIGKTNLTNQPLKFGDYDNPMLHLEHQTSVNMMYMIDFSNGMDGLLAQVNGKRKRKLWRKQNRMADEMGGMELVKPKSEMDIREAIDEFLVMKAERFRELGITDVFADDNTRDFLYEAALHPRKNGVKLFDIYQLKIGGITRGFCALGMFHDYAQAYVIAVKYDEFEKHSPGEMLLYSVIEALIDEGYMKFDLGVGLERYKQSWCPNHQELFDTILPLSAASIPYVTANRIKQDAKRYLRNNEAFWSNYKKVRKLTGKLNNRQG